MRDHVKMEELNSRQMLSLVYSYLVDDNVSMETSRAEARDLVENWLTGGIVDQNGYGADRLPASVNPETWGMLPEHQAGMARAMQYAEGG